MAIFLFNSERKLTATWHPRTVGDSILISLFNKEETEVYGTWFPCPRSQNLRDRADSVLYLSASRINAFSYHISNYTHAYQEGRLNTTGLNIITQTILFQLPMEMLIKFYWEEFWYPLGYLF